MGIHWEQHSDLCGCERCAIQWQTEHPQPVWDKVDDPDYLDCGCYADRCDCYDYDEGDDD